MNALRTTSSTSGYGKFTAPVTGNGNLRTVTVKSKSLSAFFLHVFDRATALAGGETPDYPPIPVAPSAFFASDIRFDFLAGVVIAASSTEETYTAIAADEAFIHAQLDKAGL